jgi:oligopeptide/dipeptide ABC transporter ATP-binding protein
MTAMALFKTGPFKIDASSAKSDVLLSIRDLSVSYKTRLGEVSAVDTLSLDIYRGEILGLVGESGCGKSTMGRAIMRLVRPPGVITNGQMMFRGENLLELSEKDIREVRGKYISMIFQDPMSSLNPVQRIDEHIIETIQIHEPDVSREQAEKRAVDLLERLGIGRKRLEDHPHQLSGGMRQRVMIALALALRAQLIIADEATTALDVIVQAQFLELLQQLQKEFNLTILMITHNIGLIAQIADRVAVMYAGRLAEVGPTDEIFHNSKHPYTQGLLRSVPNIELDEQELYRMEGTPPNLQYPPSGCRFHPRCPHVMERCKRQQPFLSLVGDVAHQDWIAQRYDKHLAACWLHQEEAH